MLQMFINKFRCVQVILINYYSVSIYLIMAVASYISGYIILLMIKSHISHTIYLLTYIVLYYINWLFSTIIRKRVLLFSQKSHTCGHRVSNLDHRRIVALNVDLYTRLRNSQFMKQYQIYHATKNSNLPNPYSNIHL